MDMLKYEINKIKRGRGSPMDTTFKNGVHSRPSYAGVSISDVRIPLMWKRKDHLKDMGDSRRFAIFCLARIGSQVSLKKEKKLPYLCSNYFTVISFISRFTIAL